MLTGQMMDFPLTLTHFLDRARALLSHARGRLAQARPQRARATATPTSPRARQAGQRAEAAGGEARATGWRRSAGTTTRTWRRTSACRRWARWCTRSTCGCTRTSSATSRATPRTRWSIVDRSLLPLFEKFRAQVPSHPARAGGARRRAGHRRGHARLRGSCSRPSAPSFDFPTLDENAAAMLCYTSGTTGNPKGVLYSHRSTVLHTLASSHARRARRGRGATRCCPWCRCSTPRPGGCPSRRWPAGADLVFPGPHLDAESLLSTDGTTRRSPSPAACPPSGSASSPLLDKEPKRWDLQGDAADGDRRLGGAGLADRRLRAAPRAGGAPRLGHDRDQPARHGVRG